jgi:hypothetical protein
MPEEGGLGPGDVSRLHGPDSLPATDARGAREGVGTVLRELSVAAFPPWAEGRALLS